jgi:hypothetical protein
VAGQGQVLAGLKETTKALKDMILGALDRVGGEEYLARLAIENSSAFASILGKVLPTTLQASESGGGSNVITFQRVIVMPDGHKYIEGKTPLQIAPPERRYRWRHRAPSFPNASQFGGAQQRCQ